MTPRAKGAISGLLRVCWVLFFVVALIWAFGWFVLDGSTTRSRVVRSRLTIVVETPEGERSGSSVTQQTISFPGGLSRAQGWGLTEQLVGEAVVVDLGQRGILFSTFERPSILSRMGGDAYNAGLTPFLQEKFRGEHAANASINEQYAAYLDDLNRSKPKSALQLKDVPALVRFDNLNDPTSVALVNPLDLATSFGSGLTFKGATVEITDDPITHGIEDRLPWLRSSKVAEYLFPNPTHQPPPDARAVRHLSYDDFRKLPR
ncbi:hypothetical protein [Bradyrhizobium stylosanthis]|uniref:Uncharacterized protein n=1 Tax=Bradyrhizobium stylosanthis TaxID=1803665 RepID=A0A560DZ64_9BRAD|nr:hypothetical protein [Bradyrhizobium stylosanthis]TWB02410.1 hypothetical protein FBZ96_1031192 [Bradyrhizobium stylosanthis]